MDSGLYIARLNMTILDDTRIQFALNEKDGAFVGSAMLLYRENVGHVMGFFIREDRQKRGYGRILMDDVKRNAVGHGCNVLTLNVNPKNTDAIAFYRRIGFEVWMVWTSEADRLMGVAL